MHVFATVAAVSPEHIRKCSRANSTTISATGLIRNGSSVPVYMCVCSECIAKALLLSASIVECNVLFHAQFDCIEMNGKGKDISFECERGEVAGGRKNGGNLEKRALLGVGCRMQIDRKSNVIWVARVCHQVCEHPPASSNQLQQNEVLIQ